MSAATVKSIGNFQRITLVDPFSVSDRRRWTLLTCQALKVSAWPTSSCDCSSGYYCSSQERGKLLNTGVRVCVWVNRKTVDAGCVCGALQFSWKLSKSWHNTAILFAWCSAPHEALSHVLLGTLSGSEGILDVSLFSFMGLLKLGPVKCLQNEWMNKSASHL